MQDELQPLLAAVRRNCDISNARHAGEYTLCVYLLKMREYFRWEKGYAFRDKLPDDAVGDWLRERERFWQSIEDESFSNLPLAGQSYDPFDNDAMNAALNPHGLVYSGGLGKQSTPHFFLARLGRRESQPGFTVLVSDTEFARDLTAPPAMAQGDTIYIRRESLRRMIWEKIEEWKWNRLENAMGRALRGFDFDSDNDTDTESALDAMTDRVLDAVLLHEKGEVLAGKRLGPAWEQLLAGLPHSKAELMVRAVRDHLADSLTTLPGLLDRASDTLMHFHFASLTNMHRHLAPALIQAYETSVRLGNYTPIAELMAASEDHWADLAERILEQYRASPEDLPARLQALIEDSKFER